jgi:type II secretory pathway component GspD/PulD (secretin)
VTRRGLVRSRSGLLALGLAALCGPAVLAASAAHAQTPTTRPCVPAAEGETFEVDFREVPLRTLTRLISCALQRAFIFSPPTLGDRSVTVVGPARVSARELESLWRGVLANEGLILDRRAAYELIRTDDQVPSKSFSSSGR